MPTNYTASLKTSASADEWTTATLTRAEAMKRPRRKLIVTSTCVTLGTES